MGPLAGHFERSIGSPRKTIKKAKLECTEDEIHYQWTTFKKELDSFLLDPSSEKYQNESHFFIIELYMRPHLKNIVTILLEEDDALLKSR
jgi:hypothetical protein